MTTWHRFAMAGVDPKAIDVEAQVLYRKSPYGRATRRGWAAVDRVRVRTTAAP